MIFLADLLITVTCTLGHPCSAPGKPPELCLQTGREPYSGQTLQADKTCPSGLRWRFQK
jgi:hypothetical protein